MSPSMPCMCAVLRWVLRVGLAGWVVYFGWAVLREGWDGTPMSLLATAGAFAVCAWVWCDVESVGQRRA